MNVLFDISVLGIGHFSQQSRTGIFRVIENLAAQLLVHPDVQVRFCSNTDRDNLESAFAYWQHTPGIQEASFSLPPFFRRWSRLAAKKQALISQLTEAPAMPWLKKKGKRVHIRRYEAMENLYRLLSPHLLHPGDRAGADIYHSPFHALPADIKPDAYRGIFLTCYDLIPILHPQYCEQYPIDLISSMLRSITPETWVLCISESTRRDLLEYMGGRISPERVLVTELAASESFYPSRDAAKNAFVKQKHGIPDAPYVLSLCTFEPRKNIDTAIRAFARLIEQEAVPDLNLVLVGNKGWMFEKIFAEIENSAAIRHRIIITGFVPDEDLAAIYSDALFFVYPSFYEGFGLPPLEAMKCGVPVITSDTSSLPEVVGDAGLMVPPTDLDALCQGMLSLYKNPSRRRQLAAKSLQRADRFSWKRCADETVQVYKQSLRS